MKVFDGPQTRQEYLDGQVARSVSKFRFCKVSMQDVATYHRILQAHRPAHERGGAGPILCLGTRNGREVDLFRLRFFGPRLLQPWITLLERGGADGFHSWVPLLEGCRRSRLEALRPTSVIGVEINPQAARSDVWIGSFDALPAHWTQAFGLVYSNAFDHCQDPYRTIREWRRVIRPGGHLILCYVRGQRAQATDPVGELTLNDVVALTGGELVYFHDEGSANRYSEVIVQLPRGGR